MQTNDALDPAKQNDVLYKIPYECVYIWKTGRPMLDRIKETETAGSLEHRPPAFQSTPTTPDTACFGMK